jgi:acyl-CoA synthetase (AMP-forming)/AMP-acid ligase II
MLAVPAIYKLLLQREGDRFRRITSLRRLIYGAAPIGRGLINDLYASFPDARLSNAYGMTEISNIALCLPNELALSHFNSVGVAVPGVEALIRSPDENGVGELFLRGPNMASGYWRNPELSTEVFGSGWVRSGDLATIDETGMVYLRDRATDVINRGGEKLYPGEIAEGILSHPAIDEVAVFGIADDVMGEKVAAVAVLRVGTVTTVDQLLRHASEVLPRHAVPEQLVLRYEPLPRGASGKVLKQSLREQLGW